MSEESQKLRDRLLARHVSATARLDALRRAALPAEPAPPPLSLWVELFRPHRTAWSVLAAVWLALALFHFTLGRPPAKPLPNVAPAELAAWLNQSRSRESLAQVDFPR